MWSLGILRLRGAFEYRCGRLFCGHLHTRIRTVEQGFVAKSHVIEFLSRGRTLFGPGLAERIRNIVHEMDEGKKYKQACECSQRREIRKPTRRRSRTRSRIRISSKITHGVSFS